MIAGFRSTVVAQLPWYATVAVTAAANGLTGNPYVRLVADAECLVYGVLLLVDYRGLGSLPPWRRPLLQLWGRVVISGRAAGGTVLSLIGALLSLAALVQLLR